MQMNKNLTSATINHGSDTLPDEVFNALVRTDILTQAKSIHGEEDNVDTAAGMIHATVETFVRRIDQNLSESQVQTAATLVAIQSTSPHGA